MFLYAMNYLVGYDAWTIDELKGYGDAKLDGLKAAGKVSVCRSLARTKLSCPATPKIQKMEC